MTTDPGEFTAADLNQLAQALPAPVYTDVQAGTVDDGWPPCTCPQCAQTPSPQARR
ncbi:hypothetical protein [Streptacidiphilus fuscans]|uniref:Uncharacterized protein n=1 Tax=Streptacidiphilus fuscans TaxID=2789292 RepID=A0A931B2B6_9ACTN|nr:hypothetical protein [Streptacidiphilus fuscans]MBF9069084.1 hypothetical protein [Streptacidiphilus fuscans]